MAIDLEGMGMPGAAGEEEMDLDLGMEAGADAGPLADISDEDLLAEAEKRGLIEAEDIAVEGEEGEIEGNPGDEGLGY